MGHNSQTFTRSWPASYVWPVLCRFNYL